MRFSIESKEKKIDEIEYDQHILLGEMIRNSCVNLNICPETVNGITINVMVYILTKEQQQQLMIPLEQTSINTVLSLNESILQNEDHLLFLEDKSFDVL